MKDGDKEVTYKYTDRSRSHCWSVRTRIRRKGLSKTLKRLKAKGGKGGNKIDVTVKDDVITEVKFRGGKKQ